MCQNGRDQPDAASIGSVPAWFWHSAAYLQGNVLTPLWRKLNRTRFQSVWNTFIGIKSIFVRLSTPVIIFIKTAQVLRLLRKSRWAWFHDDVIKWKHFPRYWPFVRGIHRSPVNSPHQAQWRGALVFSLICVWINGWVNTREAGDLRRYRAHYDLTIMWVLFMRSLPRQQFMLVHVGSTSVLSPRRWANVCVQYYFHFHF